MKLLMCIGVLVASTTALFAQTKMGIKLLPGVTLTNIAQEKGDDIQSIYWGNHSGPGFGIGWFVDLPFAENRAALSTGLSYSMKKFTMDIETPIAIQIYNPEMQNSTEFLILSDPQYLLHYLQVPLTVKVFTKSETKNYRFFLQGGATFEVKIAEQALDKADNYLHQLSQVSNNGEMVFKSFDIGIYGALGCEWQLKNSHGIFGALSVNKGLLKQFNSLNWMPGLSKLDYYMNVKFVQVAMEFGYIF